MLLGLMGDAIRRVPNPEYSGRFSADQHAASEYLFDHADALIYAAKEWGGYECCLQATLAGKELGRLGDARFVLRALDSEDFNARLAAVACLAFLGAESCEGPLRSLVFDDPVRASGSRPCGLTGSPGRPTHVSYSSAAVRTIKTGGCGCSREMFCVPVRIRGGHYKVQCREWHRRTGNRISNITASLPFNKCATLP
jgi:hypothetical protein